MNIQIIHTKNLRWVDIINPSNQEIQWLRDNFQFHELHLEAVAEHQQRPSIDHTDGYDFIVLLFPVYQRNTQEIIPGEVDFLVGDGFLITIHYGQINTLKILYDKIKGNQQIRATYSEKGTGFLLYKVLESLFRRSYPILDHINKDVGELEIKIFHGADFNLLSKIALMKKNIIEFRKMMKTHHSVLEKLPKYKDSYVTFPQSKIYYKDLQEYSANIWDILEALKETIDTLAETSQSLTAHRLNEITKRLSIFSAILLPATLIAFLFGIGIESLPFRHHPYGFWIVVGLMALTSISLLAIFKKKKWF